MTPGDEVREPSSARQSPDLVDLDERRGVHPEVSTTATSADGAAPGGGSRHRRVALDNRPRDVVNGGQQPGVELDPGSLGVFDDLLGPRRADDRGGCVAVMEHPGDSQLRRREPGLLRQRGQLLDGLERRVLEPLRSGRRHRLVRGAGSQPVIRN
jgi:hypothetical protein